MADVEDDSAEFLHRLVGIAPAEVQGQLLLDEMYLSDFEGVTGRVILDEKGDRLLPYRFSQLMPGWDPIYTQNYTMFDICRMDLDGNLNFEGFAKMQFNDGSATPPSDGR